MRVSESVRGEDRSTDRRIDRLIYIGRKRERERERERERKRERGEIWG